MYILKHKIPLIQCMNYRYDIIYLFQIFWQKIVHHLSTLNIIFHLAGIVVFAMNNSKVWMVEEYVKGWTYLWTNMDQCTAWIIGYLFHCVDGNACQIYSSQQFNCSHKDDKITITAPVCVLLMRTSSELPKFTSCWKSNRLVRPSNKGCYWIHSGNWH